jgi:hypothetical protein
MSVAGNDDNDVSVALGLDSIFLTNKDDLYRVCIYPIWRANNRIRFERRRFHLGLMSNTFTRAEHRSFSFKSELIEFWLELKAFSRALHPPK